MTLLGVAGADRGFFLGGGAPLGNGVTDGGVKHVYTKKKVSSQGGWGRVRTSCILPVDLPLGGYECSLEMQNI